MAVTPIYELDIPAPYDGAFFNGEKALSVAATIDGASPFGGYRLSKWFDFDGGDYILRVVSEDTAAWFEGVAADNARFLLTTRSGNGVQDVAIYLPRGRRRIDVVLSNLAPDVVGPPANAPCFIAFSLWRNGRLVYASSGEGWVFDAVAIPDASVPSPGDRRLTLPVFTVLPNWQYGITERLDWRTEILQSETDGEQRRSTRRYPRRTIEATFSRHHETRARLDNFFFGSGNNEILVPLWQEQFRLPSILGLTVTFPEGSLETREYHAGDLVLVCDRDPTVYEILEIESSDLNTDQITFTAEPDGVWGAGSRIIPLRVARVMESARNDAYTDRVGQAQARFELTEPQTWPEASWLYCAPLFRFKIDRAIAINVTYPRQSYTLDNDTGLFEVTDPGQKGRVAMRLGMSLFGRDQVYAFRQFIHRARGRAENFWMPSYTADVFATGDFSGDYIDVKNGGLVDYIESLQDAKTMLAVVFSDGRPSLYRRIVEIVEAGAVERIYLEGDLPSVTLSDVERLMFMIPARFDQDSFELQHLVDESAAVRTSLVVRSVDDDGLPDIECSFTSRPYPIEEVDAIEVSAMVLSGGVPDPYTDAVDVSGGLVSGTLKPIITTTYNPEALDVELDVVSGTLRTLLVSVNYDTEALDVDVDVISGTLIREVVVTTMDTEALDVSATVIDGVFL